MSWLLLAWHWALGHALFAGGLGALVAMLASGPTGWAVLRWLIGTRPGLLVLCVWLAASALTWQKSVSFADGYKAGAAHSSALLAASAVSASQSEARAEAAARAAETAKTNAQAAIATAAEKARADDQNRFADLQRRIAAGDYVLRDEFRCPSPPRAAGAAAASPDGAEAPAAAAWLVSQPYVYATVSDAVDAERVLGDLYECRATLDNDRAPAPVMP